MLFLQFALVVELVYTTDLKSVPRKGLRVRVPPWAPFIISFMSMFGSHKEMSADQHIGDDENLFNDEEVVDFGDLNNEYDGNSLLALRESNKEKFVTHLQKANLRNLIAYIELGGLKIKDNKNISESWQVKLDDIKKKENSLIMNPKLLLISKGQASEMALEELLRRIKEDVN